MNINRPLLIDFLLHKYKGCEFVCGETYESLTWMPVNTQPKPTLQECISGIADYEANFKSYEYGKLRFY